MTSPVQTTLDMRSIAPHERHARIFSSFAAMPAGTALELVNDHDPQPLYRQFKSDFHGQFTWNYLEQGPATWRVRIGKESGNCCGGCGS